MAEQFCDVGDVTLCYETFGDPADPTLLLIMGLGTQMIAWRVEFCEQLAGHGFHVVRFDNRDIGRSSKVDGPVPTLTQLLTAQPEGGRLPDQDMAQDAIGLLDHLGVAAAHVVGASMGGMIAQEMAARFPDRVLSLASIMSTTGNRFKGQPHLKLYPLFLKRAPTDREGMRRPRRPRVRRDRLARLRPATRPRSSAIAPGELRARARPRRAARASSARSSPRATARPASGASPRPTVVIHGTRDRLVAPVGRARHGAGHHGRRSS